MPARARAFSLPARDRLLALLAFGAVVVEVLAGSKAHSAADVIQTVAAALALSAPLLLRSRRPDAVPVLVAAVAVIIAGFDVLAVQDATTPILVLIVAVYTLASRCDGRRLAVAAAATSAALLAFAVVASGTSVIGNIVFVQGVVFAPAFLLGREVRRRARVTARLADRAKGLEAEREQRAHVAAMEERGRIAGELHDVVAHSVSSMVVQAGAARRLAAADPDRAREAITAIEETGRDALGEMRRLLGVLRRGDEDLALSPQPSLSRVRALVDRAHAAGVDVVVSVEGEAVAVPAGMDVAAYRVLEEALEAAGGGRAEVVVRWRRRELELEVVADGRGPEDERDALLGLRERVALFGGELSSGRRRGGGYGVRARLPLAAESA